MADIQSICGQCGTVIDGRRAYCTVKCKDESRKRPCAACGEPAWVSKGSITTTHRACRTSLHGTRARYTSGCRCRKCRDAVARAHADYMERRRTTNPTALRCQEAGCTTTRKAHGLCVKHLKRKQRAEGTHKPSPSDAWDTPSRLAKYKTRKATLRGATASGAGFTVDDLIDRDGRACGICGQDIPDVAYPSMESASIDHIVPISRGGKHTLKNVRATHLRCNIARGNRD